MQFSQRSSASQITASSVTTGAIAKAHFTPHPARIPPATGPRKNPRSAAALNPPIAATMCSRGERALIRMESPFGMAAPPRLPRKVTTKSAGNEVSNGTRLIPRPRITYAGISSRSAVIRSAMRCNTACTTMNATPPPVKISPISAVDRPFAAACRGRKVVRIPYAMVFITVTRNIRLTEEARERSAAHQTDDHRGATAHPRRDTQGEYFRHDQGQRHRPDDAADMHRGQAALVEVERDDRRDRHNR